MDELSSRTFVRSLSNLRVSGEPRKPRVTLDLRGLGYTLYSATDAPPPSPQSPQPAGVIVVEDDGGGGGGFANGMEPILEEDCLSLEELGEL